MAQLRDKKTSEFIAEGSPVEMVLLADEVGIDEVLFDGVGLRFNPAEVRQEYQDRIDGMKLAAADTEVPHVTDDHVTRLQDLKRQAAERSAVAVQTILEARTRAEIT